VNCVFSHGFARRVLSAAYPVMGAWCLVLGASCVAQAQTPPAQRPGQMPSLPLTQLDERAQAPDLDNRAFTLTFAQAVPIKELLLLLVRGTSLSLVPDPGIGGTFIGELKNVTVRQALGLILQPLGLDFAVAGNVVRVFKRAPETRLYEIDYIATDRTGSSSVGGDPAAHSFSRVTTTTRTDLFAELTKGVQTLLSEHATFNVDRKAGLLQVTDFPERLDRVSYYLDAVQDRVHRQVQIEARVIEVEIKDEKAQSLDWSAVSALLVGDQTAAQRATARPSFTGLRVTDLAKLMAALEAQGKVTVLANPRLLTVNNEPAIVRTDALTISVTPQIAPDAAVMLSVSPIVTGPTPVESDMLARVADGETLVIPGFTHGRDVRETKAAGIKGGWFGRSTVVTHRRVELLILLTPRIVAGVTVQ
jgi:type II secretory pathway component GspD/PulD (secretin)